MTEKLKQIIKEEVEKLPKENQDVVTSLNWEKITEEVGQKYLLNESEVNDLLVETLIILIGLDELEAYTRNIETNVGTTKADSELIAKEVGEKVFGPMNDSYIENIKKSEKVTSAKPEQNLNFILSGGDYTAFVEPASNSPLEEYSAPKAEGGGISTPSRKRATPQEGNNLEITTPTLLEIQSGTNQK